MNLPVLKDQTAIHPICGMSVNPGSAAGSFQYEGETLYFCSQHCLQKFRSDPEKFISREQTSSLLSGDRKTSTPEQLREYICPMHPEVQAYKAGPCPKCGMTL